MFVAEKGDSGDSLSLSLSLQYQAPPSPPLGTGAVKGNLLYAKDEEKFEDRQDKCVSIIERKILKKIPVAEEEEETPIFDFLRRSFGSHHHSLSLS